MDFLRRSFEQNMKVVGSKAFKKKKAVFFFRVQSPVAYWGPGPSGLWWAGELRVTFLRDGSREDE